MLVAAAVILTGAAMPARAEWHRDCRLRSDRAERLLDHAIVRYGPHSLRARRAAAALIAAQDWCWRDHHVWWDAKAHIWVTSHW